MVWEEMLLEGLAIREAVIRANAMGALAVQSPGDHDGYPTKTELDDYLEKNGEPRKE
ncbi:2-dehydro-3-deoxygluconokinase [compost metagenome]